MVPDRSFFLYGAFWWDLKQQMGLMISVTLREPSLVNTYGPSRSGKCLGASKPLPRSWWLPMHLRKLGRSRNSDPTPSNITPILYTHNSKFELVFYNFSIGSEFSGGGGVHGRSSRPWKSFSSSWTFTWATGRVKVDRRSFSESYMYHETICFRKSHQKSSVQKKRTNRSILVPLKKIIAIYPVFGNFENFVNLMGIYPRIYTHEPL